MAECICPSIHESEWDRIEHRWPERWFCRIPIRAFFGVPAGAGRDPAGLISRVQAGGYTLTEPVQLLYSLQLLSGTVQVGIDPPGEDPGDGVIRYPESFWYTVVHPGGLNGISRTRQDLHAYVAAQGKQVRETWYWFVTCPACRGDKGGDTTIIFARV